MTTYFSDTDVPRENQRRAQSRGRFSRKLPTRIRGKSCYRNATQSRGNLVSVQIDIVFDEKPAEKMDEDNMS